MGGSAIGGALSLGGSLMGAMGGNDIQNTADVGAMNQLLQNALDTALPYSQNYTNLGVSAQQDYLSNAMKQLQQAGSALSAAGTQSQIASKQGFDTSQALQAPYRDAGYQATDTYLDSLGLSRAKMGSQALAHALTNDATAVGQLNTLQSQNGQLNDLYNPGANPFVTDKTAYTNQYGAPIAPTAALLAQAVTPEQAAAYVRQNSVYDPKTGKLTYMGAGSDLKGTGNNASTKGAGQDPWTVKNANQLAGYYAPNGNPYDPNTGISRPMGYTSNSNINNAMDLAIASQNLPYANSLFNAANSTYSQLGQTLNNYTPEQQQIALAYNRGLFTQPTGRTNLY